MTLWNGDSKIFQEVVKKDENEVSCGDGLLKISNKSFVSDGGVLGKEWSVLGLVRSKDYLMVRNESGAVGLFFLFPVAATATNWYRFRVVEE